MDNRRPIPLHESEQSAKAYCDHVIYSYASMFRAFLAQDGLTRAEALALTVAIVSARESAAVSAMVGRGGAE